MGEKPYFQEMDAHEYREALDRLNLTQVKAGKLFQVGPRTSRRWALGEARVPATVAMFLNLMLERQFKLEVPATSELDGRAPRRVWNFSATLE